MACGAAAHCMKIPYNNKEEVRIILYTANFKFSCLEWEMVIHGKTCGNMLIDLRILPINKDLIQRNIHY